MAIHFVADLNFNGDNARHAIPFGFSDSAEMTRRVCETWCARVAPDDTVWIIGNVGNPVHLGCLPGVKHLVRGGSDPQAWNCLATGRFASVSDIQSLDTEHGVFTLVSDPAEAPPGTAVLHGRLLGPWDRPNHTCVAASALGWGPVSLDALMHRALPVRLSRAA